MTTAIRADQIDPNMGPAPGGTGPLAWLSPRQAPLQVLGFPWLRTEEVYRRLPLSPAEPLPPRVDTLANATAGGAIRFRSDTATLAVRVTLTGPPNMSHMPATGQCGFDAYVGDLGSQRYWGIARPVLGEDHYEQVIFTADDRTEREITLNFPLYQGVSEVLVGVDPDATLAPPTPLRPGRIVIYGTSITQGGCAARPGMAYPAILSRRIPHEFVNLGFSGNGRGEPEVARTIAEIDDVACFVLDYHANQSDPERLRTTLTEWITIVRRRHGQVPVLVLPRCRTAKGTHDAPLDQLRQDGTAALAEVVAAARRSGDEDVHFHDLSDLDLVEGTVDGSHPTDLGFLQLADRIEPELRRLLPDPA